MYSSSRYLIQERVFSFMLAQPIQFMLGQECISFITVFSFFWLLFVNIIYTRWCIIGQVLNGEWKELLIRQVIITSAPTNIFTTCRYFYFRQCVFASYHYECAHCPQSCIFISGNMYFFPTNMYLQPIDHNECAHPMHLQLVFLFPPIVFVSNHFECAHQIHLQHLSLLPPMYICIQSLRVCPPSTFTTCISISANVYMYF